MQSSQELIKNIIQKPTGLSRALKPINSFHEIFSFKPLQDSESEKLKSKLLESETLTDEETGQFQLDFQHLSLLTAECRSIQKQCIVLIGERIFKVKQLLSSYQGFKRLFTRWIQFTFSSDKSAYNALNFYEFYTNLPQADLQVKLKNMPLKAGYMLASRSGDMAIKIKIIEELASEKADRIIAEIQEKFPLKEEDKRSKLYGFDKKIRDFEDLLEGFYKAQRKLSKPQMIRLADCSKVLDLLIQNNGL